MAMAEVIDITTRRQTAVATAPQLASSDGFLMDFRPPKQIKSSRQNRYDSAFKGYMTKRARDLCWALQDSLSTSGYRNTAIRDEQIKWVIAQIIAIKEQVLRETPEHFPTAGA